MTRKIFVDCGFGGFFVDAKNLGTVLDMIEIGGDGSVPDGNDGYRTVYYTREERATLCIVDGNSIVTQSEYRRLRDCHNKVLEAAE